MFEASGFRRNETSSLPLHNVHLAVEASLCAWMRLCRSRIYITSHLKRFLNAISQIPTTPPFAHQHHAENPHSQYETSERLPNSNSTST